MSAGLMETWHAKAIRRTGGAVRTWWILNASPPWLVTGPTRPWPPLLHHFRGNPAYTWGQVADQQWRVIKAKAGERRGTVALSAGCRPVNSSRCHPAQPLRKYVHSARAAPRILDLSDGSG